jgi:hypothetical protein
MAAGLGFKTFTTGEVLSAADVNGYLMQGVLVFASAAARNAAITSPQEGQFAFTKDTNGLWYYDGAAWVASGATGDIEGVTAGVGISGGGTSGTVTITNDMATTITASGDIVVGTGSGTYDNLPIGTTNQILTADTTVSPYKVKWATPAAAGSYTAIVAETSFGSVTSVVISSIPSTYKNLVLILNSVSFDNTDRVVVRPNSSSGNQPSSTMVEGTTGETVTTSAKAQWQINLTTLSAAGTNNSWSCQFPNYASSGAKYMNFNGAYVSTAASCSIMGSTAWFNTTAISSIQIKSESGYTFDSGTYALYGVN